jgi:hypothetical protein
VDDSHREVEIPLPAGVDRDDVEIVGCYLGRSGQPVPGCGAVIVKEASRRPQCERKPEPGPELEPRSEPAIETEPEPGYPRRRRMPAKAALDAASETRGCTGPNAEATSEPHLPLSQANLRCNLHKPCPLLDVTTG